MTREDVIRMMLEAGFDPWATYYPQQFERFAEIVAAHEREACARVCDQRSANVKDDVKWEVENCAAAIRVQSKA